MGFEQLVSHLEKAGWKDFCPGEFLKIQFDIIGRSKVISLYLYHLTLTANSFYLYLSGIVKCSPLLTLDLQHYIEKRLKHK